MAEKSDVFKKIERVVIEHVQPAIDGGRYPVKRVVGDMIEVSADIYKDGHDVLAALLKFRMKGEKTWNEVPMTFIGNDEWRASFVVDHNTTYEYTIEAYANIFLSWSDEVHKKRDVASDLTSELLEGLAIIQAGVSRAEGMDKTLMHEIADQIEKRLNEKRQDDALRYALGEELKSLMLNYPDRTYATEYSKILEVVVDRVKAQYAAWYEMFPRSQGTIEGQSATFKDCERRLEEIARMGFDVVYLPPIHPIGKTNRKGPNNSLVPSPEDPGCPYAIGSEEGGHKAIEPSLGTFEDFERFRKRAEESGIEIALDIAIQCSPDHPYIKEHPEWFYKRPDGTIKYAENPPKKYEDIHQFDMYCDDMEGLWHELLSIFTFWIDKGVKIFRVDNPHTKPVPFWEWLISKVREKHPEVVFLAEAFTKPKMMKMLAKVGFSESYTYFTWRNFKQELTDYFTELTTGPMSNFFRGNLFTNTPDILPRIIQVGGRPAFQLRLVLAATLSSVYGIYNGYELCEGTPIPGKEEYLNSEKYQYKVWDWDRPGNIKDYIARINRIRKENKGLHQYDNLRFYHAENDNVLFYGKHTHDLSNIILVVVNLDPFQAHHSFVYVPIQEFNIGPDETYQVHDVLTDERFLWKGSQNYVELDPQKTPAHIFLIRKWTYREDGFDYYT